MDEFSESLNTLLKDPFDNTENFYQHLSHCYLTEANEHLFSAIVPKVFFMFEKSILKKHLVYLSLLARNNHNLLDRFLVYDNKVLNLDLENPTVLFDYYVTNRHHFLYEFFKDRIDFVVNNHENHPINRKLNLVKYVNKTNLIDVDINYLNMLSVQMQLDFTLGFWNFYIEEIRRLTDVTTLCKDIKKNIVDFDIFIFATKNCLLDTLSQYVELGNKHQWELTLYNLKSKSTSVESDIFLGYMILTLVITEVIQENCDSFRKNIQDTLLFEGLKHWILSISDNNFQITLMENIFCLIFSRRDNAFICNENNIRFVVLLLQTVLKDIQVQLSFDNKSSVQKKLLELNRYVTDVSWRFNLIVNTESLHKIKKCLVNYTIASPWTLVYLCMKARKFEGVNEVIQAYKIKNNGDLHEVILAEKLQALKLSMCKESMSSGSLWTMIDGFFQENIFIDNYGMDQNLSKVKKAKEKSKIRDEFNYFMNLFDFTLTNTDAYNDFSILIEMINNKCNLDQTVQSNCVTFFKRLRNFVQDFGANDLMLVQFLTSTKYTLNWKKYETKVLFLEELIRLMRQFYEQTEQEDNGSLNKDHSSHITFLQINELCDSYLGAECNISTNYLLRVFNYLKAFSKIFYIERDNTDLISKKNSSYFNIFYSNRSELIGTLLFEKQLNPIEFEKYFTKLKLDFLYHLIGNCFPTVNLHVEENVTIEELYHDNLLYTPDSDIILYIQKRNWLLAFILNEIYRGNTNRITFSDSRLKTFLKYQKVSKVQHLKVLFEDNAIIASLQNCISSQKIKQYFREIIIEKDLISIQSQASNNINNLETAEEIFEDKKSNKLEDSLQYY